MKVRGLSLAIGALLFAFGESSSVGSSLQSNICSTMEWNLTATEVYPPNGCSGEPFNTVVQMWENYDVKGHLVCDYADELYGETSPQLGGSGRCCGTLTCEETWGTGHCLPWFSSPGTVVMQGSHWWEGWGHTREVQWNPATGRYYCVTVGDHREVASVYVRYCDDPACLSQDPCAGGCGTAPPCYPEEEVGYDECICPTCTPTPVLIPLDGGRIELSNAADGVSFDMFGTGKLLRVGWPISENAAWLALDWNHNGAVDDGTELFGNTRVLQSGQRARNGYEVLAELDQNQDGVLSGNDLRFRDLVLWVDKNRDGRSQDGELRTIEDSGITVLSVTPRESRRVDRWGNQFRYRAPVWASRHPRARFSWDVFLVMGEPQTRAAACSGSGLTSGEIER